MSWIDVILLIILIWSIYKGFTRGLIITLASLAALLLGIYGAIKFSWYTAQLLSGKFEFNPENLNLIAFIVTIIIIVIATHLIANLVDKLVKAVALGLFNRMGGAVFNLLKSALIISVFLIIIERIDEKIPFIPKSEVGKSILYAPLQAFAPLIYPYLRSGYNKIKGNYPRPDETIASKN